MCLSIDTSDWKIISRYLAESLRLIISESILILQFGILTCFGLKGRYFILFGLTDNWLETKQLGKYASNA